MLRRTLVDTKDQLEGGFEALCRDRSKVATLKFLQPVPLCFVLRSFGLFNRGGSLKRLRWPNRKGVWLRGLDGKAGFQVDTEFGSLYLNVGLMRPWKGFTPVEHKKNGGGQVFLAYCFLRILYEGIHFCYKKRKHCFPRDKHGTRRE